jgi:galactokinase
LTVATSVTGAMSRDVPARLRDAAPPGADVIAWGPGRANLIGEYTDFNDGFVLPMALDARTWALGRSGGDRLRVRSLDEDGEVIVDLEGGDGPTHGWGMYVRAVVLAIREAGLEPVGFDGVIASDVPVGAGLSSSAALEVAIALALLPHPPDAVQLALLCQRAENAFVGVQCGIMDQLSSTAGLDGHALLIDCRALTVVSVPVPADLRIVLVDSGVRRSLTDGRYNDLREELEDAARLLGVAALRDADEELLEEGAAALSPSQLRRSRHVVSDDRRTLEAAAALASADLPRLGTLFAESQRSMDEDLGISTPELNALVRIANDTPGVVASRLTGAGFGGCTVNLVHAEEAESAGPRILERYRAETGRTGRWWSSTPADGAGRSTWPG